MLLTPSVQWSPMVTRVFSTMAQPSSKTRLPIRTPSSRQVRFLNGVPSRINGCQLSFQKRSWHQKSGS